MTTERPTLRRYASLEQGLRDKRYPLANDDMLKILTAAIGIEGFYETTGYIKAVRRDGGRSLHIHFGSTNGFASPDEIRAALGDDARVKPSEERPGTWRVSHPEQALDAIEQFGRRSPQRDHGTCAVCWTKFTPAGTCACAA